MIAAKDAPLAGKVGGAGATSCSILLGAIADGIEEQLKKEESED